MHTPGDDTSALDTEESRVEVYVTTDTSAAPHKADEPKLYVMYDAANPDLHRFRARGGKLIMFSGWADEAMPPLGTVKFYNATKGWGGIESAETPGDVWVHFSAIDGSGYRELIAGEPVEFRYETAKQDSWNYRATWVRRLDAGA